GKGAMAAVELSPKELLPYLSPFGERLSLAAINSPRAALVSGEPEAVDALLRELEAKEHFARRVRVSYASHCAQVDVIQEELLEPLEGLRPREAKLPLYSTVTGQRLSGPEVSARYWYENLRQPVQFAEGVKKLVGDGHRFFVEVSPHPLLTLSVQRTLEEQK